MLRDKDVLEGEMKICQKFKNICGFDRVYPFQHEVFKLLKQGKSIVLHAPTGSGKSEAIITPFLDNMNTSLPSQLIYSLPMRTLVDDLSKRFKKYASFKWLNVARHHGKRAEAPLFDSPIIVTTIDQTVGAYTCTPLSMPLRSGNIPAGAVSSSLLVFDEIHTFDPKRALQSAIILAKHSQELGLPFVFMSATLPDSFIEELGTQLKFEFVEAKEEDIPVRKNRQLRIYWQGEVLTPDLTKKRYNDSEGKMIVVCNTVDKAQGLYKELKGEVDCEVILLHSRFLEEDREEKERKLKEIFGKDSEGKGILISTQAIEVGLDISCDTMLTELSPVDSFIQRAGRCARWGGDGSVCVYDVENSKPYKEELMENTKEEIKKANGTVLNWELEKKLVNQVLGKYAKEWLNPENTAHILNCLSEAAFLGNKKLAEESVRKVFSSEIAIHKNPQSLEDIYSLPTIKVNTGVLRKFFKEKSPIIYKIEDNNIISDDSPDIRPVQISDLNEIIPYGFYIIHPDYASYTRESGLSFEFEGHDFTCVEKVKQEKIEYSYKKEKWIEHSQKTLKVFENILLPRYQFTLKKFAEVWNMDYADFIDKIKIAILLHDIGKLNKEWQKKAGWKEGEEPLAHSGSEDIKNLPSHAPVSAYALSPLFYEWGEVVGQVFYLVVAHHHTVGAKKVTKYRFINNWKEHIRILPFPSNNLDKINDTGGPTELGVKMPMIANYPKLYRTYTLISRLLRISDRIATTEVG